MYIKIRQTFVEEFRYINKRFTYCRGSSCRDVRDDVSGSNQQNSDGAGEWAISTKRGLYFNIIYVVSILV
jgi:hypothetical protein